MNGNRTKQLYSYIDDVSAKVCLTFQKLYNLNLYLPLQGKHAIVHSLLIIYVNYCIEIFSGRPTYK